MQDAFFPGKIWLDNHAVHINAHGGGVLEYEGTYYWYGEHKIEGRAGNTAHVGVHVYQSNDLLNWIDAGIAFDVRRVSSMIPGECILERPKVLFCKKTGKFVLWFHYEADKRYRSACVGTALADSPTGPFVFQRTFRPNPGIWPLNTPEELRDPERIRKTREAFDTISCGKNPQTPVLSVLGACLPEGQESRDMTLFLDEDGKAYHIYSSEKNSTTHIAELTDDFLSHTGRFWRAFPNRWMEGAAVFKKNGKYYFLASDCTGWAPNAARSAVADRIQGPWTELGNPAVDDDAETTYHSQSTYVLSVGDKRIYLGDRWTPENAADGRYVWLPIDFDGGRPIIHWHDRWTL